MEEPLSDEVVPVDGDFDTEVPLDGNREGEEREAPHTEEIVAQLLNQPEQQDGLVRIAASAEFAGFSVRHFRRILESEKIPVAVIGRAFFVRKSDLQIWRDNYNSKTSGGSWRKKYGKILRRPKPPTLDELLGDSLNVAFEEMRRRRPLPRVRRSLKEAEPDYLQDIEVRGDDPASLADTIMATPIRIMRRNGSARAATPSEKDRFAQALDKAHFPREAVEFLGLGSLRELLVKCQELGLTDDLRRLTRKQP